MGDEKEFQVWIEGCHLNEGKYPAMFHGTYKAKTFPEACEKWVKEKGSMDTFNREHLSYWACKFFDNEADARKSFG